MKKLLLIPLLLFAISLQAQLPGDSLITKNPLDTSSSFFKGLKGTSAFASQSGPLFFDTYSTAKSYPVVYYFAGKTILTTTTPNHIMPYKKPKRVRINLN